MARADRQAFSQGWLPRRLLDRLHARLAGIAAPSATGLVRHPEPRSIGDAEGGRQLVAGNVLLGGLHLEAPGRELWQIAPPDADFLREAHGFGWLDDLAALGDRRARRLARDWTSAWVRRHGRGRGPGWTAELAGRRLIRLICHAPFLVAEMGPADERALLASMGRQAAFLARRWHSAPPGLPRFEAVVGLLHAGIYLGGLERYAEQAIRALEATSRALIDAGGGIASRNPEELLDIFALLVWAEGALSETGRPTGPEHRAAIERIAPTLRALRHVSGGLARFHGGDAGIPGRLEAALVASGVRPRPVDGLAMGFARLSAPRVSLIVDAAPPPAGPHLAGGHASALAFELTSGRRPVIVSCGPGAALGRDWRRASRATPMHSTLAVDGLSSARFPSRHGNEAAEWFAEVPRQMPAEVTRIAEGRRFEGAHDGYVATHGLTHARVLELSHDGRILVGEDMLLALEPGHRQRFDAVREASHPAGVPFEMRFHLHPEVEAELAPDGAAVSIFLPSGESWLFRHEGPARLSLEPSVWLGRGLLRPVATKQVLLSGRAVEYATRVRWSLMRSDDRGVAVRDVQREEHEPVV